MYLSILSFITLVAAYITPFFYIVPGFGDPLLNNIMFVVGLYADEHEYSIIGSIYELYNDGSIFLAAVLFAFSVIAPISKSILLIIMSYSRSQHQTWLRWILKKIAPYSMLEIFVITILVLMSKHIPGIEKIRLDVGACFFVASIVLGVTVSNQLDKTTATSSSIGS